MLSLLFKLEETSEFELFSIPIEGKALTPH